MFRLLVFFLFLALSWPAHSLFPGKSNIFDIILNLNKYFFHKIILHTNISSTNCTECTVCTVCVYRLYSLLLYGHCGPHTAHIVCSFSQIFSFSLWSIIYAIAFFFPFNYLCIYSVFFKFSFLFQLKHF
jgi:hypothetical protein